MLAFTGDPVDRDRDLMVQGHSVLQARVPTIDSILLHREFPQSQEPTTYRGMDGCFCICFVRTQYSIHVILNLVSLTFALVDSLSYDLLSPISEGLVVLTTSFTKTLNVVTLLE